MRTLLRFVLVPLILLGGLFSLVNSCDRNPDPEIAAFIDTIPRDIPNDKNAYFAVTGHNSAPGLDPHAEGFKAVARLEESLREDRDALYRERDTLLGEPGLAVSDESGLLEETCIPDCLGFTSARKAEIGHLLENNSLLIERYRALFAYERFAETTTVPFTAEAIMPLRLTQRAVLLGAALEVHEDGAAAAVAILEEDIVFWRLVLGGTRRLVNAMIATVAIYRDLRLLSEIIANSEIDESLAERIAAVIVPLRDEERDLSPAIRGECSQILENIFRSLEGQSGRNPFKVKVQATKNDVFRWFRDDIGLYSLPAEEWLEQSRLREEDRKERGIVFFPPHRYFYNPMGKMLVPLMIPAFSSFPSKVHNLDGYLAAVNIQLGMQQRNLTQADVPALLEAACPPHCDPYTRKPFSWDEGEGALFFIDPLSEKARKIPLF